MSLIKSYAKLEKCLTWENTVILMYRGTLVSSRRTFNRITLAILDTSGRYEEAQWASRRSNEGCEKHYWMRGPVTSNVSCYNVQIYGPSMFNLILPEMKLFS